MALAPRSLRTYGRLPLLAAVALAMGAGAKGATPDLSAFIGTWTFQLDSAFTLECPALGQPSPRSVAGVVASIYPSNTPGADLTFDIGCGCAVDVNVDSSGTMLSLARTPQTCRVVPKGNFITGQVRSFTLDFSAPPVLTLMLAGDNGELDTSILSCPASLDSKFYGSGTLTRKSTAVVNCGPTVGQPNDDTIGVLPVWSEGITECPLGAGQEGVQIIMDDEEMPNGSDETGSHGEGRWLLPDDTRDRQPIPSSIHTTSLSFCRVDGSLFKPMTTSNDPAQFYAVLKLGQRCPNGPDGVVEVVKNIDNEDSPTGAASFGSPNIGPNQVQGEANVSTYTKLVFCYFRAATSADASMSAFPDLGFPYAVFHRFSGEQPAWVIAKRWQFSDDENDQNAADGYEPPDSPITTEFQSVIENPNNNTYFDLARVR